MRKFSFLIAAAVATLGMAHVAKAAPVPVALELALLMDVSGSVDASEFALQRNGYVNAFNDATVQSAITSLAPQGGVAVTMVFWSGAAQQNQVIGWTQLTSAAQASAFATTISGLGVLFQGQTAPGSAINFITPQFATNSFTGVRKIIDVSGDGAQNDGADTLTARNAALAAGVNQINGLPILGEAGLLAYYQTTIQGGTGSFTLPAATFSDFDAAIKLKIKAEVSGEGPSTPLPSSALMGSSLIGGLALLRKRFARKA